ncbi:MAG: hypothetical protein ACXVNM_00895 [Bacteroidia bacterium]
MKSALVLYILILFACFKSGAQEEPGEWSYIGPKEMKEQVKGLIKSVWVDPANPSFILAGSSSGGLFKTENASEEKPIWKNITDSYGGMNCGVSDIVVIPNTNNKTIYISTGHNSGLAKGYGNGILKTINGGISWEEVGPKAKVKDMFMVEGLTCNPQNPSEMLAYTANELFLTQDEWKTFQKIKLAADTANSAISISDADFAPFERGKFYICTRTYNFYEPKLLEYSDYGQKVKNITPTGTQAERIEVATINREKFRGRFYLAMGTTNVYIKYYNGKEFITLNGTPVNQAAGGSFWHLEFAVNQVDTNVLYIGLTEISRSTNGGKTFDKIAYYNGENTHADVRAITVAQSTPKGRKDVFIMANDGGISRLDTTLNPKWKNLNGFGLDANQFWGIDVAQDDTLFVAGGAQDNGGFLFGNNVSKNSMMGCGDGYLGLVLDKYSAIVECNPPSLFYHNVKTEQDLYLLVNEGRCETKRPLLQKDSFVYIGYHDVWRINKRKLQAGEVTFRKITQIPDLKQDNGYVKNNAIKCMSVGRNNSAVICYANPNWEKSENNGKVFYSRNINDPEEEWIDITLLLNYNSLEVCRWYDISAVEMDVNNPAAFLFLAKNPFDQTNTLLFKVNYFPDSNKCVIKKINANLPPPGLNKIITDKFSGITYLASDNGVYYSDLSQDSVKWIKLNYYQNKLPSVMVNDLSINYVNNKIVAATYGRGIWQTTLVKGPGIITTINKNSEFGNAVKVDGRLIVSRKKILTIHSKLIITKGSSIELKRGSSLIITDKNQVRDENNKLIDLDSFIHRDRGSKVIYR